MRRIFLMMALVVFLSGMVTANGDVVKEEEIFSEEDLFSQEDMIIDEEEVLSDSVEEELKEGQLNISGGIKTETSYSNYSAETDWLTQENGDKNKLFNAITGNAFFDLRLENGVKSFLSVEINYFPEGKEEENKVELPKELREKLELSAGEEITVSTTEYTDVGINEFFVDTNWDNRVYFRSGKQILKWGRSYFWNPTDLINVERKNFLDLDKVREGSYGTKIHAPFGAEKNLYFFVGMNDVEELEELSAAAKYEFLVGDTEMSLSAWNKKDKEAVYGFDISGRVFDIDLRGEVSLAAGANNPKLDYDTLELVTKDNSITKISAGFTKYFDQGNFKDRISLTGEVYYNSNGYDKNIFKRIEEVGTLENKVDFLSQVYQPYANSQYYLALFSSVDRFISPDATLNIDGIINLVDNSTIINTGISYDPLADIVIKLGLTSHWGDDYTEATFSGNKFSTSLTTEISF